MKTLFTSLALVTAIFTATSAHAGLGEGGEVKLYGFMTKHRSGPYYIGFTNRGLDSHVSFSEFNPAQIASIRACFDRGVESYAVEVVKYEAPVGSFGKSYVVGVSCVPAAGLLSRWVSFVNAAPVRP